MEINSEKIILGIEFLSCKNLNNEKKPVMVES
jgi:hypothetical protein